MRPGSRPSAGSTTDGRDLGARLPHRRQALLRLRSRATRRADSLPVRVFSGPQRAAGGPELRPCLRSPRFHERKPVGAGHHRHRGRQCARSRRLLRTRPGGVHRAHRPERGRQDHPAARRAGSPEAHPGAGASRGPGHSATRAARAGAAGFVSAADASARLAPGGAGRGGARTLCLRRGPRPAVRTRRRGGGCGARSLRPRSPQGSFRRDLVRWRTRANALRPGAGRGSRRSWLPTSRWRRSTRATSSR